MKGKINREGILEIWRKSQFKKLMCRPAGLAVDTAGDAEERYCDDDCSLFGEPFTVKILTPSGNILIADKYEPTGQTCFEICQGRSLVFDEFVDERE